MIESRLDGLEEMGKTVGGTVTGSLRQCEPANDVPIARYYCDCRLRRRNNRTGVALGSRRGSRGGERRHPLVNVRRSCFAASAPRRQAGAPLPLDPTGMRERFQNQIPFDVSQGRTDQPSSEPAARREGIGA